MFFPGAGSELYRGLGSVVLGGLLVSTVVTLFLVPTLFCLVVEFKAWLAKMLARPAYTSVEVDVLEPAQAELE